MIQAKTIDFIIDNLPNIDNINNIKVNLLKRGIISIKNKVNLIYGFYLHLDFLSINKGAVNNNDLVYNFNKKGLLTKRTYNLWDGHEEGWPENNAQILRFYEYDEDSRLIRFYAQDQQDIILNKFNMFLKSIH